MKTAIAIEMTQAVRSYLRTCQFALLLGVCIASLVCSECSAATRNPVKNEPQQISVTDSNQPIRSSELDELTRAFADRYVGLLYSACDALKKNNPDPAQRREAQVLVVDCATNIYDIASNADAFTRMLDLVVVTTLVSQVWIDDDMVRASFVRFSNFTIGRGKSANAEVLAAGGFYANVGRQPSRANVWCTTHSGGSMWRSASCLRCSSSA